MNGHRAEPQRHAERDDRARHREHAHGQKNPPAANPQCRQCNNLTVRGHAAEAEEHADQYGHRQRKRENSWKNAKEKLENLNARAAVTHKQLHQAHKLRHEENECKYGESEECVTKNLTNDIAIQDAHDENRECNTASLRAWEREPR